MSKGDYLKSKYLYIEVMRIVAILFVIYNHTGDIGFFHFSLEKTGSLPFWSNLALAVFCKIGASLFFVISGALMLNRPQERVLELYKKRISKYIIILIAASVIYAISNSLFKGTEYTIESFIKTLYSSNIKYHLWFLYAYIAYLVLLPLLKAFCAGMEDKHFIYLFAIQFVTRIINILEYFFWKDTLTMEPHLIATLPMNTVVLPMVGYYAEHRVDIQYKKEIWILWIVNILFIALSCYATYVRGIDRGLFSEKDSQKFLRETPHSVQEKEKVVK